MQENENVTQKDMAAEELKELAQAIVTLIGVFQIESARLLEQGAVDLSWVSEVMRWWT